jgi:hypothetical protein
LDYPQPDYNADQVVPAALVSEGMRQLFIYLDIELPVLRYRPQCVRCSTGQGGAVSRLAIDARAFGATKGITFTETQQ